MWTTTRGMFAAYARAQTVDISKYVCRALVCPWLKYTHTLPCLKLIIAVDQEVRTLSHSSINSNRAGHNHVTGCVFAGALARSPYILTVHGMTPNRLERHMPSVFRPTSS